MNRAQIVEFDAKNDPEGFAHKVLADFLDEACGVSSAGAFCSRHRS